MIEHSGSFQPQQELQVDKKPKMLTKEQINEQEISDENKVLIGKFLRYLKEVGREPSL